VCPSGTHRDTRNRPSTSPEEKNEKLKAERGGGFEEIVFHIERARPNAIEESGP
jgi:hypothetical protein